MAISMAVMGGTVPTSDDARALQNFLICVEMLPSAILMTFAFPSTDFKTPAGLTRVPMGGRGTLSANVGHAISIHDVVSDTVHQVRNHPPRRTKETAHRRRRGAALGSRRTRTPLRLALPSRGDGGVYAGWRVHTPSRVSPHSRGERGAGFVQFASTYSDYVCYSDSAGEAGTSDGMRRPATRHRTRTFIMMGQEMTNILRPSKISTEGCVLPSLPPSLHPRPATPAPPHAPAVPPSAVASLLRGC
jgi:hypothetical protein